MCNTNEANAQWKKLDAKRVEAVAAMLPDQPAGFGGPITDRQAWDALAQHPALRGAVSTAEKLAKTPIPDMPDGLYLDFSKTGNRTRWQRVNGQWAKRVNAFAMAECLEDKGRFLKPLEAIIRAYGAQRTWVMPAHDRGLRNFHRKQIDIDLFSSALGWTFATIDYVMGDKLGPDTRQLLRSEVKRRILDPYRDMVEGKRGVNWWMRTTNNWNAVCLAGVTGAALAMVEPKLDRASFIVAAEQYSKNFLRGFTSDGYCSEGVGYWNYGFGHYVQLSEEIWQATGGQVDLLARPEVRAAAMFGANIEIANGVYPAFADCSPSSRPSGDIMWFVSRRLGLGLRRWEQNPPAPRGSFPVALLYAFPNSASLAKPAEAARAGPGLRTWFDKAGILICRPAEGSPCRMAVALKGGHNGEHHNHNDVGSYVAVVGAEAECVDIGSETYTARTFSKQRYVSNALNSYGHPVPVVAGKLQRTGRAARGEVLKTEFTDDADTFVLDLRKAYGVKTVKKLVRTFVYSRAGEGSLTVTDAVEFSEPQTFGTAVMTFGQWRPLDEKSFLLFDLEEAARVDVEASAEFELKREEIKEDTHRPAYRIGIDLKEPVDKATIRVTITPATLGDAGEGQLLRNGSFERGAWGWSLADRGMSTLSTEQASDGKQSLKIVDPGKDRGSSASSARMRIGEAGEYELRGKYFGEEGSGVGLYMKYYDANMRMLNTTDHRGWISSIGSVGKSIGKWSPFAFRFTPPWGTVFLRVWIHSGNGATVTGYLDELAVAPVK